MLSAVCEFCFALIFCAIVHPVIELFQHALMLSEDLRVRKTAGSAWTAKNAKLEVLMSSQAEIITKLEIAYADLKCEKVSITTGYQRLSDKYKMFTKKAEREKVELVETHVTELTKLRRDLDLETHSYTEYRLNVHHRLHELHKMVALSFEEVKARCFPFPGRGAKIEEMFNI
jgi:hypothetical protein